MGNEIREEIIEIKGMKCESCVKRIETKLLQLKGVEKARVNLVEEKAYVSFDPSQIAIDVIKKEIESLGYKTNLKNKEEKNSIKQGIIYGLLPHTGCIAFIIASVLGVSFAVQLFKPLLLNPYFFYLLILISFIFATISAVIYLKKQGFITFKKSENGLEIEFVPKLMKRKWKYLSTLYGTTVGVNILLFMIIFPLLTNISIPLTGAFLAANDKNSDSISSLTLQVDIPCPGHAPLITQGLKSINGVVSVQFSFPNIFEVKYDPVKTSKQEILSLDVFKTYKATVLSNSSQQLNSQPSSGSCCGSETCGCGCRR